MSESSSDNLSKYFVGWDDDVEILLKASDSGFVILFAQN